MLLNNNICMTQHIMSKLLNQSGHQPRSTVAKQQPAWSLAHSNNEGFHSCNSTQPGPTRRLTRGPTRVREFELGQVGISLDIITPIARIEPRARFQSNSKPSTRLPLMTSNSISFFSRRSTKASVFSSSTTITSRPPACSPLALHQQSSQHPLQPSNNAHSCWLITVTLHTRPLCTLLVRYSGRRIVLTDNRMERAADGWRASEAGNTGQIALHRGWIACGLEVT